MLNKISFAQALSTNAYPGRGIMLGKDASGEHAVIAYFIMGRSVNSRNRVFVTDGCGIKTKAFDESKLSDPSLIIYAPVRVLGDTTIVTNGDQTDTIYNDILAGGSFHHACTTRCFEPDAPNFTPRISAMIEKNGQDFRLEMSVLRCNDPETQSSVRCFYEYESLKKGSALFIHTYAQDGDPIPSFTGEPEQIELGNDFEAFSEEIWNGLNEDNKVSLWTRCIDLTTGKTTTKIYNKNK